MNDTLSLLGRRSFGFIWGAFHSIYDPWFVRDVRARTAQIREGDHRGVNEMGRDFIGSMRAGLVGYAIGVCFIVGNIARDPKEPASYTPLPLHVARGYLYRNKHAFDDRA
jgi:hypothetical protein